MTILAQDQRKSNVILERSNEIAQCSSSRSEHLRFEREIEKVQLAELYAEIPEEPMTEEQLDNMYDRAIELGVVEPDWTFTSMNGQKLVKVGEKVIGRITSKFCEIEMTYRFSHSECPKVESGIMKGSVRYWGTQAEAAQDLFDRYIKRVKPRMIQLADGSWCNANISDEGLGFLNWVAERNKGGY